jgi:hypothetical protein
MAKISKGIEALLKSLGVIPEDVGALKNIPANDPLILKSPFEKGKKLYYVDEFGDDRLEEAGKIDFRLYEDDPEDGLVGSRFVSQTLNNELINSLNKGNFYEAREHMKKFQSKFEDFGADDGEADDIIDSILLNYFEE